MSDNTDSKANLSQDIPENAQDLTIFVQNLLEQMVIIYENNINFHHMT